MFAQFAHPTPAPPTLPTTISATTSSSTPSPTSPSASRATGRLRGLTYLRSYTQTRLHSPPSESTTSPDVTAPSARPGRAPSTERPPRRRRHSYNPELERPLHSSADSIPPVPDTRLRNTGPASTSGWLPAVSGRSGLSRITTRPQPTTTPSHRVASAAQASPLPAPSMVRARPSGLGPTMPEGVTATYSAAAREFAALNVPHLRAPRSASATDRQGHSTPHERRAQPRAGVSPDVSTNAHSQMPSIRFVPHDDPRASRPSLNFVPVSRILPSGTSVIRVGRYSEKDSEPDPAANAPSAAPVGFKSKVVSRRHCELWCSGGQWYIKDVKSSSGTFLNHIRLSQPNLESKPFPLNDGDVVQLGIDFKGGEEMIFRCVKIRVECNRGWQKALNSFKYVAPLLTIAWLEELHSSRVLIVPTPINTYETWRRGTRTAKMRHTPTSARYVSCQLR